MSKEHDTYLKNIKNNNIKIRLTQIIIFVCFFILWEVFSSNNILDPFIFSKPSIIFITFINMIRNKFLLLHLKTTILELILSFFLSSLLGILISIFLWWNVFLQKVLNPYLTILNSLPKTALAPIIIILIGNNIKSVIFTAVTTSIITTIISVLSSFIETDKNKIKLIVTLGGNKKQILEKVVLPSNIPTIISSLKINIGLSFVGVIVGEFLVAKSGLGYLIVYGSQIFKMEWVMMSIIILSILSAILYQFISILEKKFIKKYCG